MVRRLHAADLRSRLVLCLMEERAVFSGKVVGNPEQTRCPIEALDCLAFDDPLLQFTTNVRGFVRTPRLETS